MTYEHRYASLYGETDSDGKEHLVFENEEDEDVIPEALVTVMELY
jgi:hypothetical protein